MLLSRGEVMLSPPVCVTSGRLIDNAKAGAACPFREVGLFGIEEERLIPWARCLRAVAGHEHRRSRCPVDFMALEIRAVIADRFRETRE
jgi:hypothetical protein